MGDALGFLEDRHSWQNESRFVTWASRMKGLNGSSEASRINLRSLGTTQHKAIWYDAFETSIL